MFVNDAASVLVVFVPVFCNMVVNKRVLTSDCLIKSSELST